jgi:hypothetical protein
MPAIGTLVVDPLFELLPAFEEGKPLGADLNCFAGFRIPAGVVFIGFHVKTAKASNFNAIIFGQGIGDFMEKKINNLGGFSFSETILIFEGAD